MARRSKLFRTIAIVLIVAISVFTFTGCYGKFQLTRNLYKWNSSVGDKFINSVVMFVLLVIPVYGIVGLIDYAILNVVEFWSGKNPVTMAPGESETQLVELDGHEYQITATQNRFDVVQLDNGAKASLIYNPQEQAWYADSQQDGSRKIAQIDQEHPSILNLIQPDGKIVKMEMTSATVVQ